jgi:hypothetical protein
MSLNYFDIYKFQCVDRFKAYPGVSRRHRKVGAEVGTSSREGPGRDRCCSPTRAARETSCRSPCRPAHVERDFSIGQRHGRSRARALSCPPASSCASRPGTRPTRLGDRLTRQRRHGDLRDTGSVASLCTKPTSSATSISSATVIAEVGIPSAQRGLESLDKQAELHPCRDPAVTTKACVESESRFVLLDPSPARVVWQPHGSGNGMKMDFKFEERRRPAR